MMLTCTALGALLLLCLQATFTIAADTSFLPTNLTSWFDQSAVVLGNWLYVDAGEVWTLTNGSLGSNSAVWNQQTMAFDLSSSWSTDSVSPVLSNKTESVPLARRPDMWYDPIADTVYSMGGWAYTFGGQWWRDDTPVSLWGFKPQSNGAVEWQEKPWSPKQDAANLSSNIVSGLTVSSSNAHYNLGGSILLEPKLGSDKAQSLQEIIFYNFTTETWTNQSVPERYALYGEGQYIENYGPEGIILFLGGQWSADTTEKKENLKGLDTILIYDIQSKKFYEQNATNAPSPRAQFCSVGASTADNSSYEIFIYGGQQGKGGENPSFTVKDDLRSVFILTIPAFTWIKAPNEKAIWRAYHTCKSIGNRQMISIGGRQQEKRDDPEPWPNGLGIFDMTTLNWTGNYDSNAQEYARHLMIDNVYTGSSGYPASWSDPALLDIFKVKSSNATSTSSDTTAATASPTSLVSTGSPTLVFDDTARRSTNIKIIIPSVIVGTALLAFLVSIIFFLRKRSNKLAKNELEPEINGPIEETWNGQEMCNGQEIHAVSKPSEMAAYPLDRHYEIDSKVKQETWELQAIEASNPPDGAKSKTGLGEHKSWV